MTMHGNTDRYLSFKGIDCDGNGRVVIERVLSIITRPGNSNVFWDRFMARLEQAGKVGHRVADELCLACSHTYYIEELFEAHDDQEGLAALARLEEECC